MAVCRSYTPGSVQPGGGRLNRRHRKRRTRRAHCLHNRTHLRGCRSNHTRKSHQDRHKHHIRRGRCRHSRRQWRCPQQHIQFVVGRATSSPTILDGQGPVPRAPQIVGHQVEFIRVLARSGGVPVLRPHCQPQFLRLRNRPSASRSTHPKRCSCHWGIDVHHHVGWVRTSLSEKSSVKVASVVFQGQRMLWLKQFERKSKKRRCQVRMHPRSKSLHKTHHQWWRLRHNCTPQDRCNPNSCNRRIIVDGRVFIVIACA